VVILVSTALSAAWLLTATNVHSATRLMFTALALAGWGAVLAVWSRDGGLPTKLCWGAGLVLLTVAVARTPIGSRDIWSYVMQGRIVTVHHASPYRVRPARFPDDAFLHLTSLGWSHARSPYGPLFTAIEAGGSWLAGASVVANRLVHQVLAAVSVAGLALLHERRRGDGGSVAFLLMSPVALAVVNGGHNDLLVGALIAGAVLLMEERRHVLAGVVLAAGVLIKIVALLPAAVAVLWVWRRHGGRAAAGVGATLGAVTVAAYGLAGGMSTLRIVLNSGARTSRASLWQLVGATGVGDDLHQVSKLWALGGAVLVVVLTGLALWRWWGAGTPRPLVVASVLAFLVSWPFVMPWYVGWGLPAAGGDPRELPSTWIAIFGSGLLLAYVVRPGQPPTGVNAIVSAVAVPASLVVMVVVAVARRRSAWRPSPAV